MSEPRRHTAALLPALLALLPLAACENPLEPTTLSDFNHWKQQTRRIETLDLEEATPEEADPDQSDAETPPPPAPEKLELTVAECRALALRNNLELRVELLNPTLAEQDVTEAEAAFESLFFASASNAKTDTPTASQLSGSQVEALNADAGITIPLRTGGSVTLDTTLSRIETDNPFSTLNPSYETDFAASISHPLLRNAGRRASEHPIRIAQLSRRVSEAQTKLAVIRVLSEVDRQYWRLYATRRLLEVRRQELALAQAQLERARRRVEAELAPEVEIVRAEAGVAERQEGIIIAENNVRDVQRELKRLLNKPGLGMNTRTTLIPATEPNPVHYAPSPDRLTTAAFDNRMEMLELELRLLQDASTIDLRENELLPLLAVDYTYNANGLGRSFGHSYDRLAGVNFEDHFIGVRAEVPIGNQAAESRLRRAVLTRLQRLATRSRRAQLITQEVLTALDQLEADWQRILAARKRAIEAARVLEAEQRQFQQGLRTSTEVLDAQTRLANARASEVEALANYQITQVDLAFATGTLLGSTRVRWQPRTPDLSP